MTKGTQINQVVRFLSVSVLITVSVLQLNCSDVQGVESGRLTELAADDLTQLFADFDPEIFSPPVRNYDPDWWADSVLASMTLRERVGQLFVVRHQYYRRSSRLTPKTLGDVQEGVGGVIISRLLPPEKVKQQVSLMQQTAKVPLLIAADYERGVGRFSNNFTELPSNMAIGATGNETYAAAAGRLTAIEARALGVNWLFAPVADVNNNADNPIINIRSFGSDPEMVGNFATSFAAEAEGFGVLTTAKHFPGHGNVAVDTHSNLGQVVGSRQDLEEVELRPFREMIEGDAVSAVMTAHLWARSFDNDETPATFSKSLLQSYLRGELGFDGIIITDDIGMGALAPRYSFEERILGAIQAGVDIVLMPDDLKKAIDLVVREVEAGKIDLKQINQSARRVLLAKSRLGLASEDRHFDNWYETLAKQPLGQSIANRIATESITVTKAPVRRWSEIESICLLQFSNFRNSESVDEAMDTFATGLRARGKVSEARFVEGRRVSGVDCRADETLEHIVVATYLRLKQGRGSAGLSTSTKRLIADLGHEEERSSLVVFGSPYTANNLSDHFGHVVVAYDQTIASVGSILSELSNDGMGRGILPISVE